MRKYFFLLIICIISGCDIESPYERGYRIGYMEEWKKLNSDELKGYEDGKAAVKKTKDKDSCEDLIKDFTGMRKLHKK